jgi:hypothetical protein
MFLLRGFKDDELVGDLIDSLEEEKKEPRLGRGRRRRDESELKLDK